SEHEVVDEELGPAGEQVAQGLLAVDRVEDVVLVDPHPRKGAALTSQLVAPARVLLLRREQRQAGLDVLLRCSAGVCRQSRPPSGAPAVLIWRRRRYSPRTGGQLGARQPPISQVDRFR